MNHIEFMSKLQEFINEKGWDSYHNLKDLAVSISIESAELLEHFQWKNNDYDNLEEAEKMEIEHEIADVMIYCFTMCNKLGVDPIDIMNRKLEINKKRVFKV